MRATYRLQLGPDLDFAAARALVPYLRDLGVSHLYLSPIFAAREGSTHGYDVVDPRRVSDVLGGEGELRELCRAGLRLILDIVPNHMATDARNPLWSDPARRAEVFDVDPATGRHRRFFDIDHLAGVRVEDPAVFALTHELALRLHAEGLIDGVRVDHVDGLADPATYLTRLAGAGMHRIWVEKILEADEALPPWPIAGTTGYEFLNEADGLFVDPTAEAAFDALHREFDGDPRPFDELVREAKIEQLAGPLAPERERLEALAPGLDVAAGLVALPVYRTYARAATGEISARDRELLAAADLPPRLRAVLDLTEPGHAELVTRFQQTSGAVMAKGAEDTAFYRHVRLLALCEVGGAPGRFGRSPAAVHAANLARSLRWPLTLLATSTHDTKRSADARARLIALTADPEGWARQARTWSERHAALRTGPGPDRRHEYGLYQALVAAWPIDGERLRTYLEKTLREEKRRTSWYAPDAAFEAAAQGFAAAVLADRAFRAEISAFVAELDSWARVVSLGQVVLKLTAPGVPDIYQGDEMWLHTLVDPDNRGPVDWGRRIEALAGLRAGASPDEETLKLVTIAAVLDLRRRRPAPFAEGYEPIEADEGAFAYARADDVVVAVATRAGTDPTVAIPPRLHGDWRHALTGDRVSLSGDARLSELRAGAAFAVLERVD